MLKCARAEPSKTIVRVNVDNAVALKIFLIGACDFVRNFADVICLKLHYDGGRMKTVVNLSCYIMYFVLHWQFL